MIDGGSRMLALVWCVASHHSRFWGSALANFVGSFAAAGLIFLVVKRYYELPKTKAEAHRLLAVSYGLIKREIDAASFACEELLKFRPDQMSASGPITQAWETLQSMGTFKYISPQLSEKLVKYYSLLFRLQANIELEHKLYVNLTDAPSTANAPLQAPGNIRAIEHALCLELRELEPRLRRALEDEIEKLGKDEKKIFNEAYEPMPTTRA